MSYKSPAEICGSVQSFLTRPRSLRLRSRSPSYGEGLSACLFGPIKTIRKNCKVCHTSCWHAAAEKRYSPTRNLDFFPIFTGGACFAGICVEDIGNWILILDARQLSVFQVKVIPSPASDFGEGPVAGPSPLQQEHEGKAKPSRSPSFIWNVKARMSSLR